jgi:hypothetical protein
MFSRTCENIKKMLYVLFLGISELTGRGFNEQLGGGVGRTTVSM